MRVKSLVMVFFLIGLTKLMLKPVTIPIGLAKNILFGTLKLSTRSTKAVLKNVTVSAGPLKIRPFDFQT